MPFALFVVGTVLLIGAIRNTITGSDPNLTDLLKSDFTGKNNFAYWFFAMLVIGAIGYLPSMRTLSRAFLFLVILVLFISKGGFFEQFNSQAFQSLGE